MRPPFVVSVLTTGPEGDEQTELRGAQDRTGRHHRVILVETAQFLDPTRLQYVKATSGDSSSTFPAMFRSNQALRRAGTPATNEEIRAAALQFLRKVSGNREPSRANAAAPSAAVEEVAVASRSWFEAVTSVSRVKATAAAV
jgi:hypothetical protein